MKKAQASLEFLTMYSLAIIFILGALALLGSSFLNANSLIQDSCTSNSQTFRCESFVASNIGLVTFELKNIGRLPLTINNIVCSFNDQSNVSYVNGQILSSNELILITCDFNSLPDELIEVKLDINYNEYQANFPSFVQITMLTRPFISEKNICVGVSPTGQGIIMSAAHSQTKTPWTFVEANPTSPCQWSCNTDYDRVGNMCNLN